MTLLIVICAALCFTTASAIVACNEINLGEMVSDVACMYGITVCYKEVFGEYMGLAVGYGCGRCADLDYPFTMTENNCVECNADPGNGGSPSCNTPSTRDNELVARDSFMCASWKWDDEWVRNDDDTVCWLKKDTETPVKCNRPTDSADSGYRFTYRENDGCGPCDAVDLGNSLCTDCEGELCNIPPAVCFSGPPTAEMGGDLVAGQTCDAGQYYCSKPVFHEYTGMSSVPYGCGRCSDVGGTSRDCFEYNGSSGDGGTNNPNTFDDTQVSRASFYCHSWEYKDDKFVKKDEDTVCWLKKDTNTPIGCHGPSDKSDSTYAELNGGCGPCESTAKDAGKCTECGEERCNKYEAKADGPTFKCASWEYKDDKFIRRGEDTVCSTTPVMCNGPSDTAGAAYVEEKDGCGPCDVTAESAGKCKDCNEELCNSAAAMTTLLAIAAIIYNMV